MCQAILVGFKSHIAFFIGLFWYSSKDLDWVIFCLDTYIKVWLNSNSVEWLHNCSDHYWTADGPSNLLDKFEQKNKCCCCCHRHYCCCCCDLLQLQNDRKQGLTWCNPSKNLIPRKCICTLKQLFTVASLWNCSQMSHFHNLWVFKRYCFENVLARDLFTHSTVFKICL